jgi:hypothetical protein
MSAQEYQLALRLLFKNSHVFAAKMLGFSRQQSYYYVNSENRIPNSVRNLIILIDAIGTKRAEELLTKKGV